MNVEDLERKHFLKTLAAFKFYRLHTLRKVKVELDKFDALPDRQKCLIPDFPAFMRDIERSVEVNSEFINNLLCNAKADIFEGDHFLVDQNAAIERIVQCESDGVGENFGITSNDMEKVRSTLKQFVRDWSSSGEKERRTSYDGVLEEINSLFSSYDGSKSDIRILVPGAGLGRLAWEISRLGYTCQGNEWSLFMLLPAYFILNTCKKREEFTLYPWVSQFCNNLSRENQLCAIRIPDTVPSDLPSNVQFSMVAGDFQEIYTESSSWDCVATVYFIDTANNILDYLETIWNILVPGGYWINYGPLLYHFADVPGQDSIELSYTELRKAAQLIGFEVMKEATDIPSTYTQDANSMLQYHYRCVFTVMRRPELSIV